MDNNNNYKKNNPTNSTDNYLNSSQFNNRPVSSFGYHNSYNAQGTKDGSDQLKQTLERTRAKARNEAARRAIRKGLNSVAPGTGEIANRMLKTEKGEELVDAYS